MSSVLGRFFENWPQTINQCTQTTGMDVVTHTKHDFTHRTPHTHTLLSRIRDFFQAVRTAAIPWSERRDAHERALQPPLLL